MLFKRKKKSDNVENNMDYNVLALEALTSLCPQGVILDDAFVIEQQEIYVYVDVISIKEDVAQVVFQVHHPWMEDPIIESIATSGKDKEEALQLACENFNNHVLSVFLMAVQNTSSTQVVEGFTQTRQFFNVYKSEINGLGKREGAMKQDFWDMLQADFTKRLGNKKVYWIKVFTSKTKQKVVCEVRINGEEASELSEKLLEYAQSWECIGMYHTEKQGILLVQDEKTYEESDFTKEQIMAYTQKAIKLFEKCKDREGHKKTRTQLIKMCNDDSLAYEIFSIIPEIYCMYAYKEVEFGEKLFIVQKDKNTKEIYKSQLQSFAYIKETVNEHLAQDEVNQNVIEDVLVYSTNARAIKKALDDGDKMAELYIPGIGYYVNNQYILR